MNQFLIATSNLDNTPFERAVVYLCQHNAEGAIGMVINRTVDLKLGEVFRQMEITVSSPALNEATVLAGGPVQPHSGFVLHYPSGEWKSSLTVDKIAITTSKDILRAIASGEFSKQAILVLGYAGWSEGQLEEEIARNDWLVAPVSEDIIFDTPLDKRWEEAIHSLGIKNISQLSSWAGHA
ncbi:MAG: YqgE/AlgH family protein [Gammaproteobacteria bacterium]|jgi:putative transcriptional regulator|nr:YqgE/AlgH family protein [Gammaproteobacteria bacterium]